MKDNGVNALGRVKVANGNAFKFVPHTMMRLENSGRNSARALELAMTNPETSGIGSFEIEVLDWVSQLKYSTKAMLLDLVLSGFISLGRREKISADKMTGVLDRLQKYDLIDLLRFVAVDDEGKVMNKNKSVARINTLGRTGQLLLKELGRRPRTRDYFANFVDGDTVKRYLTANQWLIYWLTHYSRDEIVSYCPAQILNYMGREWNGARVYAAVDMKKKSMIAEPARRCEEFERESLTEERRSKFLRYVQMFDHPDQLYNMDREKISFSGRPVICYLCEDEEHVGEIAESLRDLIAEHPQQEVWFAADPWMFNYDRAGRRFLHFEGEELVLLNLAAEIGVPEMTMEECRELL